MATESGARRGKQLEARSSRSASHRGERGEPGDEAGGAAAAACEADLSASVPQPSQRKASFDNLIVVVRCGWSANARQIRLIADGVMPISAAMGRVLQCVASLGLVSSVRTSTRPYAPGTSWSSLPSARATGTRARSARACAVVARRVQRVSSSRRAPVSSTMRFGRPRGVRQLLGNRLTSADRFIHGLPTRDTGVAAPALPRRAAGASEDLTCTPRRTSWTRGRRQSALVQPSPGNPMFGRSALA